MSWFRRFIETFVFQIERFVIRGALFQLMSIAAFIVIVTLIAGYAALILTDQFQETQNALWWAFLRLTDPGYLGDDHGLRLRVISTVLTVLGYVLFMGSLVAIMTQGLNRFMSRLEAGLTPLREKNHIIILGMTHRTPLILRELLLSRGRLQRFLKRIRKGSVKIVILTEQVNSKVVYDLKAELGPLWSDKKIILRSGSPLELEHLKRVNILRAAAVIYPGSDLKEGRQYLDSSVFKLLLTCHSYAQANNMALPMIVTELVDHDRLSLIPEMGLQSVIALPSSTIISRMIAQNIRHRFLSFVYDELLTHGEGNEVYVRPVPDLAGLSVRDLAMSFPDSLFLGVLRGEGTQEKVHLNPPLDFILEANDKGIFISANYEGTMKYQVKPVPNEELPNLKALPQSLRSHRHILILGWNYKVPEILVELCSYTEEHFAVDIVCELSADERTKIISREAHDLNGLKVHHIEANYLSHSFNNTFSFEAYDNVLILSEDNLKNDEQADARTWLAYLQLTSTIRNKAIKADFLAELMNDENERAFLERNGETLISPIVMAHMMAHITLRPELNAIFNDLFGMGGAEISFYTAAEYGVLGSHSFGDLQKMACARGELALGLLRGTWGASSSKHPRLKMNPKKDAVFELTKKDRLVVLTTYAASHQEPQTSLSLASRPQP